MLSAYFDFWARVWNDAALTLDERSMGVEWIVEFGSIRKPLDQIHPDTGIARLVAPLKQRIENADCSGLTVILRIDPAKGLMHALQGSETVVRKAQAALGQSRDMPPGKIV